MTYEYMCTACGHAWEAEQSISADALKTCPNCHADTARRQVSGGAGFILKGGGWYSDLYASAPKKSGTEDAKPAAKTDTAPAKTESATKDSGGGGTDKGSSGSSGSSSSGSSGTPTSSTPAGSKATGAASGA